MSLLDLNTVEFWPQLNKLHLTFDDLSPVMHTLAESEHLETDVLGQSFLGNPIHSVTLGKGSIKILAWTQMHGDEPTATAAVMDVLSYLLSDPNALPLENFKALFTLKIIPMLNPDGAQAKTRCNAQGIDINRDAIALQSPEGQILRNTVNTFKPDSSSARAIFADSAPSETWDPQSGAWSYSIGWTYELEESYICNEDVDNIAGGDNNYPGTPK